MSTAVPTLPPPVRPLGAPRRVRVTIVGDARVLAHNADLLRVTYGAGVSVMVNAAELGVVVEDVDAERVWTDGDVVAGAVSVWHRVAGRWHCVTEHGIQTACDADMGAALLNPASEVLRYQAGEQR